MPKAHLGCGRIPASLIGHLEVDDLAPIRAALDGWPHVVPERTTFYGAREIIVKDPAGNAVFFAAH
ncbi:MAG: hypothetical protein QM820_62070 [Minicystis sp.]